MADSAIQETSDCTKQKQLRIDKLKLPTLAAGTFKTKVNQSHIGDDSWQVHFDLRSEEGKVPTLLAALFLNEIFRIPGSCGAQRSSIQLTQKPGSVQNNPLGMLAGLFSEIKQELAMESRKFSLIQSEYLKECIQRSRYPGIDGSIRPPETANTIGSQLKNNLSFLVRLLLEIMEGCSIPCSALTPKITGALSGPEDIKFKAACDMPSLPDIYSAKESKAACETSSPPHSIVKQLTDASSYKNSPTSGFNSLFTIKRK